MLKFLILDTGRILLAYFAIFVSVAFSLQLLSSFPSIHMPIAAVAAIVWVYIWIRVEMALDGKSVMQTIVIYATVLLVQLQLSRFVMSPLDVSSENFWLGRFETIAAPLTVLTAIRRVGVYAFERPYLIIFKIFFYGTFALGTLVIVQMFLRSALFPPVFS